MSDHRPPSIDPRAAHRWQQLPVQAAPWLHEEVARRMQERLDWIKHQPDSWVHWEPLRGGLQAHALLAQRYPQARCVALELTESARQRVMQDVAQPWWKPQSWFGAKVEVTGEVQHPAQMLWSNMALHMSADPQALIHQWGQALQTDGFLMFSCLGPDTLKELRALYQAMQWPPPSHEFTDMHDWGDMLVGVGFAEPVMDVEHITLTFETPERLLQELRELGRNLNAARAPGLRGRAWHRQLLQALAGQPLQLTFEVVYGHAFKPKARHPVREHSEISLDAMRAALKRNRPPGP